MKSKPQPPTLFPFDDIYDDIGVGWPRPDRSGDYVLTLCAVRSPAAIPTLKSPHLKDVKFFFRSHHEGGREQHWLQLGYFSSRARAEECLKALRAIYPAAFLGKRIHDA